MLDKLQAANRRICWDMCKPSLPSRPPTDVLIFRCRGRCTGNVVPPDNFRGRCLQQLLHVSCSICLSVEVLANRTASNLDYPLCSLCMPGDMLVLGLHVAGNICTPKHQNSKPKQLQVRDPHWQAHYRSSCISNERCGARPTSGELPC